MAEVRKQYPDALIESHFDKEAYGERVGHIEVPWPKRKMNLFKTFLKNLASLIIPKGDSAIRLPMLMATLTDLVKFIVSFQTLLSLSSKLLYIDKPNQTRKTKL